MIYGYFIPYKVYVEFNRFGALVLDWVVGYVDCTDIVIIDLCSFGFKGEFKEEVTELVSFDDDIGDRPIFCFGTGSGSSYLFFGRLRDNIVAEINIITGGGFASVGVIV